MVTNKKMLLSAVVVVSLLLTVASFGLAFDLTDYGFQPAGSYDFGGETVTIISWTSERMANYFNDYLPVAGRIAEAEELFNCKIEFMQTRDIPEVNLNRLLAGDSSNDLWHVQNKIGYWELVAYNALYPVQELLGDQYYEMQPPSFIAVEEALKYDDQYWGLGPVEWRPIYGYQNDMMVVAYNKSLFEREGIEDLFEVYQAGEWTWDKATDIAVKTTLDLDLDGATDQWGIVDLRPWDLAVANGAAISKIDEHGNVVFTADEPAFIEALEQYHQWWTGLEVQMPTYSSGDLRDTFINGRAAMYFGSTAFALADIMELMEDEWGIVPFPMGPSTDQHHWTVQALNTTVIPVNADNPEALAALRSFLWREEDVYANDFLAAHVNSEDAAMVLLTGNQEWAGEASRLLESFLGDFETYTREVADGTRSAAGAMAEIKPVIQSNFDDLFDQ